MKKNEPMVTVVVVAYNHQKYIRQAMDSILAQKTDFDIEILVHDDVSTDGTKEILMKYKDEYPDKIRLILEKENQFSKTGGGFLESVYSRASGKYIAVCEGDDYWTDPSKLQRQVDFLEKKPGHTICFHPVIIKHEDTGEESLYPIPKKGHTYTLNELLRHNFIQTNSVLYRNLRDYRGVCPDGILPQDWFTHIFHAKRGKIGYINNPMSVYRRHTGGLWWKDSNNQIEFWRRNAMRHIRFFESVEQLFRGNGLYLSIIHNSIGKFIDEICYEVGDRDDYKIASQIVKSFPQYVAMSMTQNVSEGTQPYLQIKDLKNRVDKLNEDCTTLEQEKKELLAQIHQRDIQLLDILNSKSWQITRPLRVLYKLRKH
ncbi:glycosyltransferase [Candidatus Saccharibacteria bacterium]|nr:glycosyltransferase [Candidatus Saccharibacteria bacterium]